MLATRSVSTARTRPGWKRLGLFARRSLRALRGEFAALHPRLLPAWLARPLPRLAFPRLRTTLYRLAGISIGPKSLLAGPLDLIGPGPIAKRLRIGRGCWVNSPFFADLTDKITIGDRVTIGHHVGLVTANHEIGPIEQRAGPCISAPIVIGDGTWIAARVTILQGVTIGRGSVIGAGSVVTRDVPPRTLAAGTPARVVRELTQDEYRLM